MSDVDGFNNLLAVLRAVRCNEAGCMAVDEHFVADAAIVRNITIVRFFPRLPVDHLEGVRV